MHFRKLWDAFYRLRKLCQMLLLLSSSFWIQSRNTFTEVVSKCQQNTYFQAIDWLISMLQNILQAKNMAKFVSIFCSEGPFLWHKNGSNAGVIAWGLKSSQLYNIHKLFEYSIFLHLSIKCYLIKTPNFSLQHWQFFLQKSK